MDPIPFAPISVLANQHGEFTLRFHPAQGVSLSGARLSCEFRCSAQAGPALMIPTVATSMEGNVLVGTFTWTKEQSAALMPKGTQFTEKTPYYIEVDLAFSDDLSGDSSMRFVSFANVAPGGNRLRG